MDSTEGGTLVEDNRSSKIGERQGFQSCMQGATQTLLPFPGVAQSLEHLNFIRLGVSEPRNNLSIKVWEQYDFFRDTRIGCEAVQCGKAILLATQEEASRASREPVDEEEAMAQAWWEGAGEPDKPIGTEQDRTKGTNPTRVV
ncbi:hypothetical protein R1flu_008397 [Riccia fluitans]|uniref:Uncharacterized protein n=1 Tax=Riccia fluitans TaxID=41844 RepID=A0ABD1YF61_9MARC